jgi:hypothetical protein
MSTSTFYVQEFSLIETVFEGNVTLKETKQATVDALKLSIENGTKRFLVDCSQLKHGSSVVELYSMGEYFGHLNIDRSHKQAVIMPDSQELVKNLRFYETATRNRGYDVMAFDDRSKALSWLLND